MTEKESTPADILWGNAVFLFLTPPLAIAGVIWWFTSMPFTWAPLIAAFVLFMVTGVVITAGYHRLFSHRTYKATAPVRLAFAIVGAASWQNSVIEWSAHHRRHHRFVDTDKDPYNALRGFWYSHILWICHKGQYHGNLNNVKDLFRDPIAAWQHKYYWPLSIAINVLVPLSLGLWTGDIASMLLWAGLVRVVIGHHTTFFINSWAHIHGSQPYSDQNTSRDSALVALFTHGEGFHNYHHAFETDYRNGRAWYHWDPGKWLINILAWLGLASDLRRIPDDMLLRRRFEENHSRFAELLESLGETIEDWGEAISQERHLAHAATRIETALTDLRAKRSAWQTAIKENRSRHHIRSLHRTMRRTQRSIKASLNEWELMLRQYTLQMATAV